MLETFAKLAAWLGKPTLVLSGVWVACVLVLVLIAHPWFAPAKNLADPYIGWIQLGLIGSSAILAVLFVSKGWTWSNRRIVRRKQRQARLKDLESLTIDERHILQAYLADGTRTLGWAADNVTGTPEKSHQPGSWLGRSTAAIGQKRRGSDFRTIRRRLLSSWGGSPAMSNFRRSVHVGPCVGDLWWWFGSYHPEKSSQVRRSVAVFQQESGARFIAGKQRLNPLASWRTRHYRPDTRGALSEQPVHRCG